MRTCKHSFEDPIDHFIGILVGLNSSQYFQYFSTILKVQVLGLQFSPKHLMELIPKVNIKLLLIERIFCQFGETYELIPRNHVKSTIDLLTWTVVIFSLYSVQIYIIFSIYLIQIYSCKVIFEVSVKTLLFCKLLSILWRGQF